MPGKNNENNPPDTSKDVMDAVLCCLELLYEFKSFKVSVPKKIKTNVISNVKNNVKNSYEESINEFEIIPLKLHIGLSMGPTHHIILGIDESTEKRLEYFITGPSVKKSGELLAQAPSGFLLVSDICWKIFIESLNGISKINEEWNLNQENFTSTANANSPKNKRNSVTPIISEYKKSIGTKKFNHMIISEQESELSNFIQKLQSVAQSRTFMYKRIDNINKPRLIPFLEESLGRTLNSTLLDLEYDPNAILNSESMRNFNQIRNVVSVFILLKSLEISRFDQTQNISKAQEALHHILATTKTYGGCCRQFGCDDKLTTALLIWGMDGYSHEKGDAPFAVEAALKISAKLEELFDLDFSIGIASGSAYVSHFSQYNCKKNNLNS